MNNYSKGTFTHQSLRVEKETLLMLREHCAANNLFMAHFAAAAIKEKIERDNGYDNVARDNWRIIFGTEPPEDFGKLV
jgi:hypothetical protein